MQIRVVTLFPEFFVSPLKTGLVGRALERGEVTVGFANPRDFATDRHRTVDDQPYGGGGGMVGRVEPWAAAIEAGAAPGGPVLLLTPTGTPLAQERLARWASEEALTLVAGRYEGFDERIRTVVTEEVSLGDFILTGGEPVAMAIIDGVVRLRPGTLGNVDSPHLDSFSGGLDGLLEYPQYTRPPVWRGLEVPEVLRSGDHARVGAWRRAQSLARTRARRPDLLRTARLSAADHVALAEIRKGEVRPRLVVSAPLGVSLESLWAWAAAYELEVEIVAGVDEVLAWTDRIEALPPQRLPEAPTRRRRRSPPAEVPARSLLRAVTAPSPPDGALVVGLAPASPERPVLDPRQVRRAEGLVLSVESGLPRELWAGVLPPVRSSGVGGPLDPGMALPIHLDRLWGEGR